MQYWSLGWSHSYSKSWPKGVTPQPYGVTPWPKGVTPILSERFIYDTCFAPS